MILDITASLSYNLGKLCAGSILKSLNLPPETMTAEMYVSLQIEYNRTISSLFL